MQSGTARGVSVFGVAGAPSLAAQQQSAVEWETRECRRSLKQLDAFKFRCTDAPLRIRVNGRLLPEGEAPGPESAAATGYAEITIEDNGIGLEEQYLDRIITPFERLHGQEEYEGTGMGLAISRRIVERHGGALTASSIPSHRATFRLCLPVSALEGDSP